MGFLERLYTGNYDKLFDFNLDIIRHVVEHLDIKTRIVLLSDLGVEGKGDRLLVELCKALGADTFLVQSAAMKYLDREIFKEAGLTLRFFRQPSPVYPQLWGDFVFNLSALDLLLNCGPRARNILLESKSRVS